MTNRFDSQFDPEELAKMTHRGLKPRQHVDSPRVTQQNLNCLKSTQQEEAKLGVSVRRLFARLSDSISGTFKGMLAPPTKKVYQCTTYGHVLKPGWEGERPLCMDCGAVINSLDEVRGSSPKNPAPKKGFQQADRKYVK